MRPIPRNQLEAIPVEYRELIEALVENVETMTGQRAQLPPVEALPAGSDLARVIRKVNELLTRIQE